MFDFIYDVKFLAGAIFILGYIIIFRVSADIKFLHNEIKKLQKKIDDLENR